MLRRRWRLRVAGIALILVTHLGFAVGSLVLPVSGISEETIQPDPNKLTPAAKLVDCGPAGLALLDKTKGSRQTDSGCDAAAKERGIFALAVGGGGVFLLLAIEWSWRRGALGMR